jgi:hypothetical protein
MGEPTVAHFGPALPMWIIRINLDGTQFAEREPLPQANQ